MGRWTPPPKPTEPSWTLGIRLRNLRCSLGLFVADAAKQAGWPIGEWHRAEDGVLSVTRTTEALKFLGGA